MAEVHADDQHDYLLPRYNGGIELLGKLRSGGAMSDEARAAMVTELKEVVNSIPEVVDQTERLRDAASTISDSEVERIWDRRFGDDASRTHVDDNTHEQDEWGASDGQGNRVIFLNSFVRHITPRIYWKLREIANRAVAAAMASTGQSVAAGLPPPSELGVRCIEMLHMSTGTEHYPAKTHLGWHRDDGSVYTMVLQLSSRGVDYEGAEFLYTDNLTANRVEEALDTAGEYEPSRRGGVIFDAEVLHAVKKLRSGKRTVLALEFWPLGDAWTDFDPMQFVGGKYTTTTHSDLEGHSKSGMNRLPSLPMDPPPGCTPEGGVYRPECWEQPFRRVQ